MSDFQTLFKEKIKSLIDGDANLAAVEEFVFGAADAETAFPYISMPELPLERDDTFSYDLHQGDIDLEIWSDNDTSGQAEQLGTALKNLLHGSPFDLVADDGTWRATESEQIRRRTGEMPATDRVNRKLWLCVLRFRYRFQNIS